MYVLHPLSMLIVDDDDEEKLDVVHDDGDDEATHACIQYVRMLYTAYVCCELL